MIVLCGINSAIQLYVFPAPVNNITDCFHLYGYDVRFACLPIRPTDCERGEGETVSEGGKLNLFGDRRIYSDALDTITILTSPQSISID